MKPVSIVVAVVGAVLVAVIVWVLGPGARWVLEHVDGVAIGGPTGLVGKDLAEALDAVRGRALAVATGLAALVAVFYTARNADTARRTFQLGERGHVTDRYGKAIEQLGSAQAPVRLGGLYALEQLGQNTPDPALRQTIVDVICAYLRMPYTPPPDQVAKAEPVDQPTAVATPSGGRDSREAASRPSASSPPTCATGLRRSTAGGVRHLPTPTHGTGPTSGSTSPAPRFSTSS
ncbi:hypothetical protein ACIBHX_52220 [Nonomuraea sp. NPDC050536]|uniref:hypothetical protein n=1 Tax=Nonomuraea sp. NPDC050536 TaxID=3364366 RepID=UPI0037C7486A